MLLLLRSFSFLRKFFVENDSVLFLSMCVTFLSKKKENIYLKKNNLRESSLDELVEDVIFG